MSTTPRNKEEIICKCYKLTESQIKAHISSKNLTSVSAVTKACGAGGGCGSCHMLLQLFIDQEKRKSVVASTPASAANTVEKEGKMGFFKKLFTKPAIITPATGSNDNTLVQYLFLFILYLTGAV